MLCLGHTAGCIPSVLIVAFGTFQKQWHCGTMKEWGCTSTLPSHTPVRYLGLQLYVTLDYNSTPVSVLQYFSLRTGIRSRAYYHKDRAFSCHQIVVNYCCFHACVHAGSNKLAMGTLSIERTPSMPATTVQPSA